MDRTPERNERAAWCAVIALALCCGGTALLLALSGTGVLGAGVRRSSSLLVLGGVALLVAALVSWLRRRRVQR